MCVRISNALYELHTNVNLVSENGISWNAPNKNYKITSVHLLGAAINPEEVSIEQGFGIPIIEEVDEFHNKYSTEDTILEEYYRALKEDVSLLEKRENKVWQQDYVIYITNKRFPVKYLLTLTEMVYLKKQIIWDMLV
jgi:hypothetical protein